MERVKPLMDMDAAIKAAEAACDAAGALLRTKFRAELGSSMKPDRTIVTEADAAAERVMRDVLTAAFPDHLVTGEELPPEGVAGRYEWVLDPIDGTVAFACGKATFSSLVALLEDGVPILGVIDQPHARERWVGALGRATTFTSLDEGRGMTPFPLEGGRAGLGVETLQSPRLIRTGRHPHPAPSPFQGEGTPSAPNASAPSPAFNTETCKPSAVTALAEARLGTTDPYLFAPDELKMFERLRAGARITSFSGDGYAYGLLVSGHLDLIFETGLSRHDIAALVPILLGAGCAATDAQGVTYEGRALSDGKFSLLAAGNGVLLQKALST